jgi:hypothetical protein
MRLLNQIPARLTAEQAAWVINCQPADVPILVAARLLKPLGNPPPHSVKYFAASELLEQMKDRTWLAQDPSAQRSGHRQQPFPFYRQYVPMLLLIAIFAFSTYRTGDDLSCEQLILDIITIRIINTCGSSRAPARMKQWQYHEDLYKRRGHLGDNGKWRNVFCRRHLYRGSVVLRCNFQK